MSAALIVLLVVAVVVLYTLARTVRIIPQARAGVVERLGRYSRTLTPGLAIVVPFRRPRARDDRSPRASRVVRPTAGHHGGQPRGEHRFRHLLPSDRTEIGHV